MARNQAAWLDGRGRSLRIGEAPMPQAGPGQVLIRNKAVAVNPVDRSIQDHGIFIKQWPNILGSDVAGEVVAAGEGVETLNIGDRVTSHMISTITSNPAEGGFQLYSIGQAAITARIPSSVSYAQAAVLPLAIDTAAVGLYKPTSEKCLGLPWPSLNPKLLDETIVVWGGSSSVGSMAVQLAVASGVKVVTTASSHNFDFCKRCGASEVVDYNNSTVVEDVVRAVQKVGGAFAGGYDAIAVQDRSYKYMIPIMEKLGGGNMAAVHKGPAEVPESVKVAHVLGVDEFTHPLWKDYITGALEAGRLQCLPEPWIIGSGFESIQRGLDENRKGVSARKVVIEL